MVYHINVFISHSWSYDQHYNKLYNWIFREKWRSPDNIPIIFHDMSVPKNHPIHYASTDRELKEAIWSRIYNSDVVVILTGVYASYSKWIKKEIEGAKKYQKPILAVNPWGQVRKSSIVARSADMLVGWNKKSVLGGILNLYLQV
jgi:hypothetical protein